MCNGPYTNPKNKHLQKVSLDKKDDTAISHYIQHRFIKGSGKRCTR